MLTDRQREPAYPKELVSLLPLSQDFLFRVQATISPAGFTSASAVFSEIKCVIAVDLLRLRHSINTSSTLQSSPTPTPTYSHCSNHGVHLVAYNNKYFNNSESFHGQSQSLRALQTHNPKEIAKFLQYTGTCQLLGFPLLTNVTTSLTKAKKNGQGG